MYPLRLVVLSLSILLLGCFLTLSPSGGDAMDRPGTIVHAFSLPDGSPVYLDSVYVDSVSQYTIVVREWWNPNRVIAVSMIPPPALIPNQLVDVEGVTGKFADGRPAILYPVVYGYLDANGNLLPRPHVVKPPDKPADWPWKVDMTAVSAAKAEASIMDGGYFQLLTGSDDTIAWAKQQTGEVTLDGKVVTAGTSQFAGCVYIEEDDRSCGIKVETGGTFDPGDVVKVIGTVAIADGECCISSATVTPPETGPYTADVPTPIFMIHRNLGGEAFGEQPAVKGGVGLNNIGLLVKAVGRVTAVGSTYFYFDDGSALNDDLGVGTGVRVETGHAVAGNPIPIPPVDAYVSVTGISSCMLDGSDVLRVLRPRDSDDVTSPTATIKYVRPGGAGTKDGSSWDNAMERVSDALADATFGTEIWVAAGTYYEGITLKSHVGLYGGFSVGDLNRADRNPETNVTILDGAQLTGDNCSVVTIEQGAVRNTTIDGFTIRNGSGTKDAQTPTRRGGGILCRNASPTIANNVITSNLTSYASSLGGGIMCWDSSAVISNDVITNNGTIVDSSGTSGGGVSILGSGSVTLTHNTIENNDGGQGGGIYCGGPSNAIVSHNVIRQNNASSAGGGIRSFMASGALTLTNNMITENTGPGAGIAAYGSNNVLISHNHICDNLTSNSAVPAGIDCTNSSPKILNNLLSGNRHVNPSDAGIGIRCYNGSPIITNNTIADNTGSGIACVGSTNPGAGIFNNILAFNSGYGISSTSSTPMLSHNCVWGNVSGGYSSGLNPDPDSISDDPKLASDSIHIQLDSPCINKGDDSAVQDIYLDIDGQARINGAHVDIGADEYYYPDGCIQYGLMLEADPTWVEAGQIGTITAIVYDRVAEETVPGRRVDFLVSDEGELVSIYNDDGGEWTPDDPPTTGYGITGDNGSVHAEVTRETVGTTTITIRVSNSCGTGETTRSIGIWFYDPTLACSDWPMFMHDPQHTGLSGVDYDNETTETFNDGSPNWSAPVATSQGQLFGLPLYDSSPVVKNGILVVGVWDSEQTGDVFAFSADALGGNEPVQIWSASTHATYPPNPPMGGVSSTACIYDDKVYIGSANGYLYCLNLLTGAQIWSAPVFDANTPVERRKVYSSPVVHNGVVYIGNHAAMLYAFDAATGSVVSGWPALLGASSYHGTSSPAIATVGNNDYVLVGCDDSYIYRVNVDTRTWERLNLGVRVESSPTVSGNFAYVGCTQMAYNNLWKLSIEPFQVSDSTGLNHEVRTTPALAFDYVYVGDDTGNEFYWVSADDLDLPDPRIRFAADPYGYFLSSAALTNMEASAGIAYVGNDNGRLYALNALDVRDQLASYNAGGLIRSSPAIVYMLDDEDNLNRWVFVTSRGNGGKLLAFKTQIN